MPAVGLAIATLRAQGVHQFDPVRFCFIEALARRAAAHSGEVRQVLDGKLAAALAAYSTQQAAAQAAAQGLQQHSARLDGEHQPGPLADLVQQLDRQARATGDTPTADAVVAPVELKALRHFRSTWSRLSVDRQLSQSKAKVPENAGPLNSHRLVLRALQCMQDTAPAYLSRFMSSVDALLWLDQASVGGAPAAGHSARSERDRKRKTGRSKTGRSKTG